MDMFSFELPVIAWLLLATGFVVALLTVAFGLKPMRKAARFPNPSMPSPVEEDPEAEGNEEETPAAKWPKASVVVYADKDKEWIDACLEMLDDQDYPDYEIIVVAETTAESAQTLAGSYAETHPRVHVTFMQPGSRSLSRRKLANTIGIKAARGEVIVTTLCNARIPSRQWLRRIMAPFVDDNSVDVSLGFVHLDFSEMRGPRKWFRQFDSVLASCRWIGAAACGRPFRGDGANLAFRRSIFFDHKGYARTINLHGGDDDLFISEISDGDNTRITVSPDSVMTLEYGGAANRVWSIRKEHYSFTSRWLPKGPFVRSWLVTFAQWLAPLLLAAAALLALPSLVAAVAAAVILLTFWGFEIAVYRAAASRLGAVRLWWSVPLFWLILPFSNMMFRYSQRNLRVKNFTWQRHKS